MAVFFRNAAVGVLALVAAVAPARAENLADAMAMAYRNSNLLEQNRALLRATDETVAQAVAALRPVLAFIANANYSDSNAPLASSTTSASVTLNASLDIYDGGDGRLAVEAAKENVLAARSNLVSLEQQVLLSTVQAFMSVRSAVQTVELRRNNLRLVTEQLRAAQDRFDVGEVTRTDVSLAQSRLALSRSNLVAAQGQLSTAREAYKLAVGQYPENLGSVSNLPELPDTLDAARGIAMRNHPDIEAAQHNVTVSELSLLRARAARRPSLQAEVNLSRADGGINNSSVGLQLNQTLYSGGALISAERQALANREASLAALHRTVRTIEQGVANAWGDLAVARAQLQASDQRIRAARLAFEGVKEEARLGARTTLDVLDAEQELLDALTARVTAGANRNVAVYRVLASMGMLTVKHLGLGVPTYDAAAYYNAVKNAPIRSVQGVQLDRVLKSIGKE